MNIQDLILLKQCLHYPQTRCTCIISVYGFIRTSIISPNNRCLKIREEKCRGVLFWQIYNHEEYFNRFISSRLEILKFSHSFKLLTTETKVFVNCIMSAIDDSTINFLGGGNLLILHIYRDSRLYRDHFINIDLKQIFSSSEMWIRYLLLHYSACDNWSIRFIAVRTVYLTVKHTAELNYLF